MDKHDKKSWALVRTSDDDSGSQDALLGSSESDNGAEPTQKYLAARRRWSMGLLLTLINVAISLTAVGAVSLIIGSRKVGYDLPLQDRIVFTDVDMKTMLKPPNMSRFWTLEAESIYIRPPSPEVDAAWDELSLENLEMTTITSEQARALGRDVNILSKVPESWGLGPDRYFAQVQVFHLIHCLDEVRKQMHYDHYHLERFGKDPPVEFVNHKNHCVHVLLENLLCQAGSDIVLHNWRETFHVPLADFHPPRQCRNFDALWDSAKERAIPDYKAKWRKLQIPEGATVLPAPTPRLYP